MPPVRGGAAALLDELLAAMSPDRPPSAAGADTGAEDRAVATWAEDSAVATWAFGRRPVVLPERLSPSDGDLAAAH